MNSEGKPCRLFFEHSTAWLLESSEKNAVHLTFAAPDWAAPNLMGLWLDFSIVRRPFRR
jgi:hypothetical protein